MQQHNVAARLASVCVACEAQGKDVNFLYPEVAIVTM